MLVLKIAAIAALVLIAIVLFMIAPGTKCTRARAWKGKLFAHRGLHGEGRAENALRAFEAACAAGYGIELDVHFSRDGQLIVFHDDNLVRMCGDSRRPEELTVAELRQLSLQPTGEKIPTFDEVLELVDGRVPLLVEIKNCKNIAALTDAVCARLSRYQGAYLIESFNPLCLMRLKKIAPQVVRGQLVSSREDTAQTTGPALAVALSCLLLNVLSRPDFVAYNIADTKSLAPRLQRALYHTPMAAWTVRDERQLALAAERGDMVIFEHILP